MAENLLLGKETYELLNEPLLGEQDPNTKVRMLIEAEYLRRLNRYHRLDRMLCQKYEMTFQDFTARHIVAEKGYSWEVEKDAMDWETAIGGIKTIRRKLKEVQQMHNV